MSDGAANTAPVCPEDVIAACPVNAEVQQLKAKVRRMEDDMAAVVARMSEVDALVKSQIAGLTGEVANNTQIAAKTQKDVGQVWDGVQELQVLVRGIGTAKKRPSKKRG